MSLHLLAAVVPWVLALGLISTGASILAVSVIRKVPFVDAFGRLKAMLFPPRLPAMKMHETLTTCLDCGYHHQKKPRPRCLICRSERLT